jgi:hypothetical protein
MFNLQIDPRSQDLVKILTDFVKSHVSAREIATLVDHNKKKKKYQNYK